MPGLRIAGTTNSAGTAGLKTEAMAQQQERRKHAAATSPSAGQQQAILWSFITLRA
jgi:hypothetical protein